MGNEIIERKRNTIYVNDDIVKKKKHEKNNEIDDEWAIIYERLYNYDNRIVKIYDITDNIITMEKVDYKYSLNYYVKEYDSDYNHDKLNKYIAQYLDIWNNFFQFSLNHLKTHYFFHTDYKLSNVVVDINDNLKVIDPDSFKRENFFGEIEPGKYFESIMRLGECRRFYKNDYDHDLEKDIWIPKKKSLY